MIGVPPHLEARWQELESPMRAYVDHYLALEQPAACAEAAATTRVAVVAAPGLPPAFAEDLVHGASALRSAFPQLQRTLAGITHKRSRVTVRVVCEGVHDEAFFGILRATHRPVRFIEEHRLQTDGGQLREARVAIDLAGIIRQLRAA